MSKQELIENIRKHNPSAQIDFLGSFEEPELESYLDHLQYRLQPRGEMSYWNRPEGSAVVTRNP